MRVAQLLNIEEVNIMEEMRMIRFYPLYDSTEAFSLLTHSRSYRRALTRRVCHFCRRHSSLYGVVGELGRVHWGFALEIDCSSKNTSEAIITMKQYLKNFKHIDGATVSGEED